jgi:hypothetical protein
MLSMFTSLLQKVTISQEVVAQWTTSGDYGEVNESILEKLAYFTNLAMVISETIVPVFQTIQEIYPKYRGFQCTTDYEVPFLTTLHAFLQQFDQHVQQFTTMMTITTVLKHNNEVNGVNDMTEEERLEIFHHARDMMSTYMEIWSEYSKMVIIWNDTKVPDYTRRESEGKLISLEFLWRAVGVAIQCSEYEGSFDLLDNSQHTVITHYLDELAEYR